MANVLFLVLLICEFGLFSCFDSTRKYHFVDLKLNWTEAQQYCRTKYTDLATIENMNDIQKLQKPNYYYLVWIGLYDDPASWKWSTLSQSQALTYQNWALGSPIYPKVPKTCVKMESNGTWNIEVCNTKLFFVCYQETNTSQKAYTLVENLLSWNEAQTQCRKDYTDLAVIGNKEENSLIQSIKLNASVWIGLYRTQWGWSDKSSSPFRNWAGLQPDNYHGDEYCVVENTRNQWHDDSCNPKYPFWCYDVQKFKRVVKMKFQSSADLSDPANSIQLFQQINKMFEKQGWINVKLQWKTLPRKQKEEEKD